MLTINFIVNLFKITSERERFEDCLSILEPKIKVLAKILNWYGKIAVSVQKNSVVLFHCFNEFMETWPWHDIVHRGFLFLNYLSLLAVLFENWVP